MPRKSTELTEAQMVSGLTSPEVYRPRGKGVHLNAKIENGMVEWDCPVCNHHNTQHWYGREYHVCINCEQPTSIK